MERTLLKLQAEKKAAARNFSPLRFGWLEAILGRAGLGLPSVLKRLEFYGAVLFKRWHLVLCRPALTVYPLRRWRLRIAAFASGGRDAASPLSPSLRQPTLDPSLITLYIMPAASLACTARATCPPS